MHGGDPTMTRRRFLGKAGVGVLGLAAAGGIGGAVVEAVVRHPPRAPVPPRWHSRPDLQIPALTVTRREPAASREPIFIAPYNAPNAQAGAVIVDGSGEPLWENPLADRVTTNFKVQRYRGGPGLGWGGG